MIRNVVIHVTNEQPLLADLYALPSAADAGLVCTNVRGLDGKRPVFIDHVASTFFFPYHVIRFLEIPAGAAKGAELGAGGRPDRADADESAASGAGGDGAARSQPPGVSDDAAERLPVVVGVTADASEDEDPEVELEIDEGFLKRIRDI